MIKVLFLLLSVSSVFAYQTPKMAIPQGSCRPLDVRSKNPGLKDFLSKPRDQDSIGWCYAFAAADLLSVKLGVPVSSIHMSALYNQAAEKSIAMRIGYWASSLVEKSEFKDIYEGGWSDMALNAAVSGKEICREEDFPFDQGFYSNSGTLAYMKSLEAQRLALKKKKGAKDCVNCNKKKEAVDPFSEQQRMADILSRNRMNDAVEKIVRTSCKDKMVKVPKLEIKTMDRPHFWQTGSNKYEQDLADFKVQLTKYFQTINTQLEAGQPVAISYDVKHVTKSSGLHASSIVARQWKDGKCMFKIRNSWGQGCAAYKSSVPCDSAEGAYWVSDQQLYEMVEDITYIK